MFFEHVHQMVSEIICSKDPIENDQNRKKKFFDFLEEMRTTQFAFQIFVPHMGSRFF